MRSHLQGIVLLIVLLLAFWFIWDKAGPVLGDAISGDDGAIVAESGEETTELDADGEPVEPPLTPAEIADLQSALTAAGYEPGPIDGIMGDATVAAATEARVDLSLQDVSDRELLSALNERLETPRSDLSSDLDPLSETAG